MKKILKATLDYPLQRINHLRFYRQKDEQTVIIAGSPRSGTSWLFEILLELMPRSLGLWEPLRMSKYPYMRSLTSSFRPYLSPSEQYPGYRQFFSDLLAGRNARFDTIHSWNIREFKNYLSKKPRLLIKFVRANRLLPWLIEHFPFLQVLLIVRHPCAVVASQLNHPSWNYTRIQNDSRYPVVSREFLRELPHIRKLMDFSLTPEEKLAVTWGFDYYIPLRYHIEQKVHTLFYENLVTRGELEMGRITEHLGLNMDPEYLKLLKRPSQSTITNHNMLFTSPINKWKDQLSPGQVSRIMRVVKGFGLDIYNDQPEPVKDFS